jgi:hypothetical protein
MKNLTEKQELILAEITNEFVKINEEKKNRPKGSLFDIDGLLSQKESDIEDRQQIEVNNLLYEEMLKSAMQDDMNKLNDDLNEYGLCAYIPINWKKDGNSFVIDTIKRKDDSGYHSESSIDLRYKLEYAWISFESGISSIEKKSQKYKLSCYVFSNTERFYNNINEFAKDTIIIDKIKKLLNK